MITYEQFQKIKLPENIVANYSQSSWGISIYFMVIKPDSQGVNSGIAFARLYQFPDDTDSVYLDSLSVNSEERRCGWGLQLQELRETIGRQFGCKRSFLWVVEDSWMYEWYKRRGYSYLSQYTDNGADDDKAVWMFKNL